MFEAEIELKNKMKEKGIKVLLVAKEIKRPYGTLAGWLNGFAPMPEDVRKKILEIINKKEGV